MLSSELRAPVGNPGVLQNTTAEPVDRRRRHDLFSRLDPAEVAELVDALGSGPSWGNPVGVRVSSSAPPPEGQRMRRLGSVRGHRIPQPGGLPPGVLGEWWSAPDGLSRSLHGLPRHGGESAASPRSGAGGHAGRASPPVPALPALVVTPRGPAQARARGRSLAVLTACVRILTGRVRLAPWTLHCSLECPLQAPFLVAPCVPACCRRCWAPSWNVRSRARTSST